MPVSELSQHLDEVRDFESLHPDRANGIDFETAHLSRLASYALSAATCMSCLTNNPMPRLHAARIHEEVVKDGADTEAVREELTLLLDDMLKEAGKTTRSAIADLFGDIESRQACMTEVEDLSEEDSDAG